MSYMDAGCTTTDFFHALVELTFISKPSVIGNISIYPFYVSYNCHCRKKTVGSTKQKTSGNDSAAVVGACVQAFAMCRITNSYISSCMNCLLVETPPPKAFDSPRILDHSHFVHRLELLKKSTFQRVYG